MKKNKPTTEPLQDQSAINRNTKKTPVAKAKKDKINNLKMVIIGKYRPYCNTCNKFKNEPFSSNDIAWNKLNAHFKEEPFHIGGVEDEV